ncbi:MAG: M23 family metallopeptidase [Chloroflexi bacterium]|nr:M23 family metallopeptidase [Chloroflexota bacterium]
MSIIRFLLLILIGLPAGAAAQSELPPVFQPAPRPIPARIQYRSGISLELYFTTLAQGSSGLLRLTGADITSAGATFRGEEQPFIPLGEGDWYALITVDMDAPARSYELRVLARRGTESLSFTDDVLIESAGYILQEFDLPIDRARLVDGEVEAAEFETLAALTAAASDEPLWDAAGFALPLDSPLTSPFGSFRLLNGVRETRHTGWDQIAPVGTPIRAMAAGRVVFAGRLEIRGNTVLIDHGVGLYSGYAHFSDLLVTAGQTVSAGQIIGSSGDTGRSTGPHLHWEIVARGKWVDGAIFLDLWLPA